MNLEEIRSKLKSGKTIESVCQEYQITFQQLTDYMFQLGGEDGYKYCRTAKHKTPLGQFTRTGQLYISERGGRYFIRNKKKWFGTYSSLEDAVKVRDWFMLQGRWDTRWVNRACRECNVRRCSK